MFSRPDAYERFMGRWSRRLAPELVSFAEVRDGDAVLDVGSGTGALALAVRAAMKTGLVVGVEPSEEFVRHASRENADPLIRFELGDAMTLQFSDAAFDKTVSALVLNFVPEPARALKEMIRVTKRGGIVAAAVWDYGGGMQMLRAFWDEAAAFDPSLEPPDEAHMPLCTKGALGSLWTAEGLEHVQETELTVPLHFANFADYWEPFLLSRDLRAPTSRVCLRIARTC